MSYCNQKISLIIPTLNAEKYIDRLIGIIESQTVMPDEIIVIDSESADATVEFCRKYETVKIIEIRRKDFDHGGTKNQAIRESTGDIIVLLSQDVTPICNDFIEKLILPLINDKSVAASSGRQIAYENASVREKLIRQFNYKEYSFVRDRSDLPKLGIKTYYFSDACSAYRRSAIESVGLYNCPSLICCDMIIVAKLISTGWKIAYVAEAEVYHSHNYSLKTQYKRNFDIGADIAMNKDLLEGVNTASEGLRMTKFVLSRLLLKGHFLMAAYFCLDCLVRFIAHIDGNNYTRYNLEQIKRKTLNPGFWDKLNAAKTSGSMDF